MRGLAIAVIIAIASGICAAQATAQDATGLYEPFPQGGTVKQSKRFVDQLPGVLGRYSQGELEQGRFVGRALLPAPKRAGSPTARAQAGGAGGWVVAGIGGGLVTLFLLLRRPRTPGMAA